MTKGTRTVLVLVLSLVVAGIASLLVLRRVQSIPIKEVEVRSYQVAVASRDLPTGTRLTAADVKLVPWPQSSPVAGAFIHTDDVLNRGLIASVVANEPLTSSKVAPAEAGAGLPPMIKPGMRAVSIKVDDVIGVAGFVVPGAKVDVIVTLNAQGQGQSQSRTVVENVQVLASGTKIDQQQARDGRPIPASVVTLLVSPADAERISLAGNVGRITLTLRNPMDAEALSASGTRLSSLLGAPEPLPEAAPPPRRPVTRTVAAPPPAAPEPPSIYTVETIRAAKRTAEVVK